MAVVGTEQDFGAAVGGVGGLGMHREATGETLAGPVRQQRGHRAAQRRGAQPQGGHQHIAQGHQPAHARRWIADESLQHRFQQRTRRVPADAVGGQGDIGVILVVEALRQRLLQQ
ncbi:hypothetical protein D3C71_1492860 [compost metagenome]